MCGGRGTRLATDREKPMFPISGTPMVERVRRALADSKVEQIFAVTSPATPETAATLDCRTIETPGEGYVTDLDQVLADDRIARPALTVAADLPLLDGESVDAVVDAASDSLTVTVPVGRKRALGLSVDTQFRYRGQAVTPAGINVVDDADDEVWVRRDPGYAVNVNRRADAQRAEWWLAGRE